MTQDQKEKIVELWQDYSMFATDDGATGTYYTGALRTIREMCWILGNPISELLKECEGMDEE